MNLTPEIREQVANEVKRFAADMHLSADQKEKPCRVLSRMLEGNWAITCRHIQTSRRLISAKKYYLAVTRSARVS